MAAFTIKQSEPLHIENTVLSLGRTDLSVNNAFNTYRDMKLDGVISGSMSFIKSMLSKTNFTITTPDGATLKEKKVIEALNKSLDGGEFTKQGLVSQWLSALDYGCSLNEVVFKRDDKGNMVFGNITPIHLTNVKRFEMKGNKLNKLHLSPAENDGLVVNKDTKDSTISGDKVLFFRIESDSDFPLGKSLLYGAYTSWKTKKILQEYEAIGVAKNLSGVLQIKVPSAYLDRYFNEPNSDEAIHVSTILDQAEMLHAGRGSYIMLPSDSTDNGVAMFEVKGVDAGGNSSYDVGGAISRYNTEIQLSLQSMVLSLGAEGGGSKSLAENSNHHLNMFIESIQKTLSTEFRRMLRNAYSLNGLNPDDAPTIEWDATEPVDWDTFTRGWSRLLGSGGITPTKDLEGWLREQGGAPQADYNNVLETDSKADDSERLESDKQA